MESTELMAPIPPSNPESEGAEGKGKPAVFCCKIRLMLWLIFCWSVLAFCKFKLATASALLSCWKREIAACKEELVLLTI